MPDNELIKAIQEFNKKLDNLTESQKRIEQAVELIDTNLDLFSGATGEKLHENNTLLQSVHKGGMTFLLRLDSIQKYIQQLARLNGWKLPEKQKPPVAE